MSCTETGPQKYVWCHCRFCEDYRAAVVEYNRSLPHIEIDQKHMRGERNPQYEDQVEIGMSNDQPVMMSRGDLYGE